MFSIYYSLAIAIILVPASSEETSNAMEDLPLNISHPGGDLNGPPPMNLSDKMKVVIASLSDPYFMAGINAMIYGSPILIVFGVIGNILALIVVTRKKNRQISCTTYMAALAVTDTGSLFTLFYLWYTIIAGTVWTVPDCVGWVYVVFLNTAGSGFLIIGVTFDRFMAICFPLKSRVWCTPKRARIMVGCIMAFVAIFYIPMAIWSNVVDGNVCVAFGWPTTANAVLANINLIALPILPFFVLLIMNVWIIVSVKRSGKFQRRAESGFSKNKRNGFDALTEDGKRKENSGQQQSQSGTRDRQLTIMLLAVSIAYVIIILPVSVRVLVYSFVSQYSSPRAYALFVFLFCVINLILFLNNTINFYLYFLTGSKFRKDIKQLLRPIFGICCKRKENDEMQMNSSSAQSGGAHFYRSIPADGTTIVTSVGDERENMTAE